MQRAVFVAQEQFARGADPLDHGLEARAVGQAEGTAFAQPVHPLPEFALERLAVAALELCVARHAVDLRAALDSGFSLEEHADAAYSYRAALSDLGLARRLFGGDMTLSATRLEKF